MLQLCWSFWMMSDKKRCKKLEKYIQLSELAKFRSYIKRYSIDVTGWSDEKGNSLLHLSCKYGCEVILRLVERYLQLS